jgi:hypothetical protein|tara:strand:- start:437 stop:712 length:276 start_codon:yes stop_codon:yes gene_type:complete
MDHIDIFMDQAFVQVDGKMVLGVDKYQFREALKALMLAGGDAMYNYTRDLQGNLGNGLESLNASTYGTPYFNTEEDAQSYIDALRTELWGR